MGSGWGAWGPIGAGTAALWGRGNRSNTTLKIEPGPQGHVSRVHRRAVGEPRRRAQNARNRGERDIGHRPSPGASGDQSESLIAERGEGREPAAEARHQRCSREQLRLAVKEVLADQPDRHTTQHIDGQRTDWKVGVRACLHQRAQQIATDASGASRDEYPEENHRLLAKKGTTHSSGPY